MQVSSIIRIVFFVLFFSIGAAALGVSVLCEDLVKYYSNEQLIESDRKSIEKLESLNEDYDTILDVLEKDPNSLKRVAPATIGASYENANAAYPRATARQLNAARLAMMDPNEGVIEPVIPNWLSRCSKSSNNMTLFYSGVALMLVAFICFRPVKPLK